MKQLRVTIDNKAYDVLVETIDGGTTPPISVNRNAPVTFSSPVVAPVSVAAPASKVPAAAGAIPSPLAGKIVSIDVKPGQAVTEGTLLATVEAMKMNTFINAPRAGTVTAVNVNPGDAVEEGAPLLVLS